MFTREWNKGNWTLAPTTTPISVKNISIVVAGPQVVTMTTRSRVSPVTDECSLPLFSWHLDSLRCPRPISRMNSNRFPGKIGVAAFCSSVIKMWNLSLHDSAKDNCDQFLLVSQRPNVRHALSRKSRTLTFWITCAYALLVIGFAKVIKWSLLAILGSWNNWKIAGLFVRNRSRVPVFLVLNFTICLRLFDCVKSFNLRPVEVGLKSPAITTSALRCFISRLSKFDRM